jgi:hypothetical protein
MNSNVSIISYVDETGDVSKSYLIISQKSPWDAPEDEVVEVKNNYEAHKMLNLLEKHFGIKNLHKGV